MNFSNIGFLNFNTKYNKELKSGAITCSMTVSNKNQEGEYETQYISAIVPKQYRTDLIDGCLKSSAKREKSKLLEIKGFITMNGAYANAVVTKAKIYQSQEEALASAYDTPNNTPFSNVENVPDAKLPF